MNVSMDIINRYRSFFYLRVTLFLEIDARRSLSNFVQQCTVAKMQIIFMCELKTVLSFGQFFNLIFDPN